MDSIKTTIDLRAGDTVYRVKWRTMEISKGTAVSVEEKSPRIEVSARFGCDDVVLEARLLEERHDAGTCSYYWDRNMLNDDVLEWIDSIEDTKSNIRKASCDGIINYDYCWVDTDIREMLGLRVGGRPTWMAMFDEFDKADWEECVEQ